MKTVYEKSDVVPLIGEVFREFGYEGTSMSRITERTRLGKGSLYHFFPGGKEEMGRAVLAHVDAWFVEHIFEPLERGEPRHAIARMWQGVEEYFQSGNRICLIGAFALDDTRDRFGAVIRGYFVRWIDALGKALSRAGVDEVRAACLAEKVVGGIQGALVLSRALNSPEAFTRALARMVAEVDSAVN